MKALLLIDIQNDFTPAGGYKPAGAPDGALAVPAGSQVIDVANRLMPGYPWVIATQDWHPADHRSFASQHAGRNVGEVITWDGVDQVLWPDHCVQGTFGAMLCDGLHRERINAVIQKGTDRDIDSYSGFFDNGHHQATGLHELLQSHGVDAVDIIGLATDYCVKFTALDAAALGYETTVLLEGCRGVELKPGDINAAVQAMRDAGVNVIESTPAIYPTTK